MFSYFPALILTRFWCKVLPFAPQTVLNTSQSYQEEKKSDQRVQVQQSNADLIRETWMSTEEVNILDSVIKSRIENCIEGSLSFLLKQVISSDQILLEFSIAN